MRVLYAVLHDLSYIYVCCISAVQLDEIEAHESQYRDIIQGESHGI